MKLSEFKNQLSRLSELHFQTSNGSNVPKYFHVTEIGLTTKHFIDCGGTVRDEKVASMQLWVEEKDANHRLTPEKLIKIIDLSAKLFDGEDFELEVEYQTETVGRYGLKFDGNTFVLTNKQTACLAEDSCGIPKVKNLDIKVLNSCTPGGGCC